MFYSHSIAMVWLCLSTLLRGSLTLDLSPSNIFFQSMALKAPNFLSVKRNVQGIHFWPNTSFKLLWTEYWRLKQEMNWWALTGWYFQLTLINQVDFAKHPMEKSTVPWLKGWHRFKTVDIRLWLNGCYSLPPLLTSMFVTLSWALNHQKLGKSKMMIRNW